MPLLSDKEQDLLRRYIILNVVRQAFERDIEALAQLQLKFSEPLMEFFTNQLYSVSKELTPLKRAMARQQLTIEKSVNDGFFTEYVYRYRGYEGVTRILNAQLKHAAFSYVTALLSNKKE
ncbi:hypothetical protein [Halalkalibacterium ligniniphilum]|uniref:hypothetical protein n=1 Tax=Halalkalibacterium ligniniphilum TaxID=1134413 RepID=UPI0003480343|nr:hypothetical protein [Halalkalibacterium ligniniphilum]